MIENAKALLSNLFTFMLALIAAIVIWAFAVRQADPTITELYQVPIQVVGLPADGRLLQQGQSTMQVGVEAPTSILSELTEGDFQAFIDLNQLPFGSNTVPVQVKVNNERVKIVARTPEEVTVETEQIISREIPVLADIRGNAASGYRFGETVVEPEQITVTGPASRVNALAEARVTSFLDNVRDSRTLSLRPFFYDQQGAVVGVGGLGLSSELVQVTVPVEELEGFAQKPITVSWVGEPAKGYRLLNVSVEPASILVSGRPTQIELLARLRTETIDITGLKASVTRQVALDLPDGITQVESQAIFVTVEVEPILTSSVVNRKPELRALGEGLTATVDTNEVRVFLFGPLETVDSLAEQDVRVTLDLLNLGAGSYNLEPIVAVSANDLEVRSVQPAFVTVVISQVMTMTETITETGVVTATSGLLRLPLVPATGAGSGPPGGPGLWLAWILPAISFLPLRRYQPVNWHG